MIPLPIYLFVLVELIAVSYGDIKTNKIPNFWSILNLIAFIVLLWIAPGYYFFEPQTFLFSAVFLAVGFVLFLVNIMGAGDTKFLFTFFLLIPVTVHETTFYHLLMSTVLIGGFVFLQNILKHFRTLLDAFKNHDLQAVKNCFGTKFSFAPVILVAWLWLGWTLRNKF